MKIAVLGKKVTGLAVIDYLKNHKIDYDVFDNISPNTKHNTTKHYDVAIVSPGWPKDHWLIDLLRSDGSEIVSELEFSYRLIKKPIIAVSGTNGKTTTCHLIHNILTASGVRSALAGNIGTPLIRYVDSKEKYDLFICEVSSFQMEQTSTFKPLVYILLNITEDHLDRHGSLNEYKFLKLKPVKSEDNKDYFISSFDKNIDINFNIRPKRLYFSLHDKTDIYKLGKYIILGDLKFNYDDFRLKSGHNLENIMAALLASNIFVHLDKQKTEEALHNFKTLEHRVSYVDTVDKVDFIDDSKATNVDAVEAAIDSFDKKGKISLLLGGRYKGGDFSKILKRDDKIRAIVAFGEARGEIRSQLHSGQFVVPALNLKGAVYAAFNFAAQGDTVLLSPGCSSFDEFESYKQRGDSFKEIVAKIKKEYSY